MTLHLPEPCMTFSLQLPKPRHSTAAACIALSRADRLAVGHACIMHLVHQVLCCTLGYVCRSCNG
jgi:hypothetical protein